MNGQNRNRFGESVIIKVKHTNRGKTNKTIIRKMVVDKYIKLNELELKLRERFDVSHDKGIDLFYVDDDKDLITISFDDELNLTLESNNIPTFEIVIKPKKTDNECPQENLVNVQKV